MLDLTAAPPLAAAALDAIVERADDLDTTDWATPIAWLPGWTVRELLDHVGIAADRQAEAFEHTVAGRSEQPPFPVPTGAEPIEIVEGLRVGRDRLVNALAKLDHDHLTGLTPMPFAPVPTPVALQVTVLEYAMHRWDLERALGDRTADLGSEVAGPGFAFGASLLTMLGSLAVAVPDPPVAYRFTSPDASYALARGADGWAVVDEPTCAECTIAGSASDLVMFQVGRLTADDDALTISGDAAAAAADFKAYFPGP